MLESLDDPARASHLWGMSGNEHFDGRRFYNPGDEPPPGLWRLLRWKLTRKPPPWPAPPRVEARDTPPRRVFGEDLRVSWVGHATVLIQTGGLNVLTDPFWSDRASPFAFAGPRRARLPGIRFDDLPPIDIVLVSHAHYDHMDIPTIARLVAAHDPVVLTPLGNDRVIRAKVGGARTVALDWGQAHEVRTDQGALRVVCARVEHWSARSLTDRNRTLWGGFVIEGPEDAPAREPLFFAGDTAWGDGEWAAEARALVGPRPFRLALLPIGGYAPRWFMKSKHMTPKEAVRAHLKLRARRSMAIHHATIPMTDEPYGEPLELLALALTRHRVPAEDFRAVDIGDAWDVP